MRASTSALLSSILVAIPAAFASITVVHVGGGGYFDSFTQPGLLGMVAEGFIWYVACGFLSTLLAMRFGATRSTPIYRGLVYVIIGDIFISLPLAYVSTTLYQSIASGAFSSVGSYPHSWVFYFRALRWYLLCGFLAGALDLLLNRRKR